jgi:hypothetical protein
MINQLESTTSQYDQALTASLSTAASGNDLITALTTFDTSQLSDRLRFVLTNYSKSHATSEAEGVLIQDALATL